jgi:hypothetical protein
MNRIANIQDAMQEMHSDWETMRWNPYQIAKALSLVIGREVRPQQMYNYARNGRIVRGVQGLRTFSAEEVATFVLRYINK